MKDNVNKEEEYDKIKRELVSFLENCEIKTINFHQFGFLIMYFPVYMIIHDLEESKYTGKILFQEKENDKKINEDMVEESFESFEVHVGSNTLHLGLCEPVVFNIEEKNENGESIFKKYGDLVSLNKEGYDFEALKHKLGNKCIGMLIDDIKDDKTKQNKKIKESYFMHLPFINFPPIYGISLINNPVINRKKREKRKEGDEEKVLSIIDYWKHFSAKLSLLDKNDFRDLTVSSYPKETTANWFITKSKFIKFPFFKGITWIKHLRNEFDDLFDGIVDVAFTVQPWAALPASEFHEPPFDVDIVYKNVCTEFNCTSLIFKTKKREYVFIGDYILNCFNNLLKIKIKNLYEMDSVGIEESIKHYYKLLMKHSNNAKKQARKPINLSQIDMETWCLFENKMALRLTIDSQIYKHLEEIKKDHKGMKEEEVVADYFVEKFSNTAEGHEKFQELIRTEG